MENKLGSLYESDIEKLSGSEIMDVMDEISSMNTKMHALSVQAEKQSEKYAADIIFKAMTEKYDILKNRWEELRNK